jgi:hypothetical protein
MPCDTRLTQGQTLAQRMMQVKAALKRLEAQLAAGRVSVVLSDRGAVSFQGWKDTDNVTDVCAYRTLTASNSWELKQAVAKAEARQGRKVNAQAVAAGWHSHDGGKTWGTH